MTSPGGLSGITTDTFANSFSYPRNLVNVNGTPYFTFNGEGLWKIDSTRNAVLVKYINPSTKSSYPQEFTNVNGTSYFQQ
jgi:ELWxxDGT repeat protein